MAVIKAINPKRGGSLKRLIDYVTKEEKTEGKYISGQNCNSETAMEEMKTTKEQFRKLDGREYKHFIQSFKPGEVTAEKAHQIALEWSQKHFKGYEVLIATHEDKKHIHTHFVINSVSFENGKKYHQSKADLKEMKLSSDRICERENLSVIKNKSQEVTTFNQNKYRAIQRSMEGNFKSYVVDTALTVDKVLDKSKSKEEFIKGMNDLGYEVKWSDTNKNITFKDNEGNKVRLSNLEKTFKDTRFSKEGLENEFSKLKGKEQFTERTERRFSGTTRTAEPGIIESTTNRAIEGNKQKLSGTKDSISKSTGANIYTELSKQGTKQGNNNFNRESDRVTRKDINEPGRTSEQLQKYSDRANTADGQVYEVPSKGSSTRSLQKSTETRKIKINNNGQGDHNNDRSISNSNNMPSNDIGNNLSNQVEKKKDLRLGR